MAEVVGFILILIIIYSIYTFFKNLYFSILVGLNPIATFFNTEPKTIFWILLVALCILLIVIIAKITQFKYENSTPNYQNTQPSAKYSTATTNYTKCPKCNGYLNEKYGMHGKFLGCSNYPNCIYTENIAKPLKSNEPSIEEPKISYVPKQLLNYKEQEFLNKLKNVIKNSYAIETQVSYSSLFKKNLENADRISNINHPKIKYSSELSYVADFVLYNKSTQLPVATIEFNGLSHYDLGKIEQDEKKKAICYQAELPYITFWTKNPVDSSICENTESYIRHRLIKLIPNFTQPSEAIKNSEQN